MSYRITMSDCQQLISQLPCPGYKTLAQRLGWNVNKVTVTLILIRHLGQKVFGGTIPPVQHTNQVLRFITTNTVEPLYKQSGVKGLAHDIRMHDTVFLNLLEVIIASPATPTSERNIAIELRTYLQFSENGLTQMVANWP